MGLKKEGLDFIHFIEPDNEDSLKEFYKSFPKH